MSRDFLVDNADWSVHYLVVDTKNWWPGKKILVSTRLAGEIDWTNGLVNLYVARQRIKDSPAYDASMTIDRAYDEKLLTYYGIKSAAARSLGYECLSLKSVEPESHLGLRVVAAERTDVERPGR